MRIVLTYNLKRADDEANAEFDTLATIQDLSRILASLGHVVTPLDVGGPIDRLVGELRAIAPELVFNMAEGERGRFREAFYPALFEQLGIPHTASSASVLALCLDKELAKRIVGAAGVRVAAGISGELVIVKPIFEGSSKGITQASVVTRRDAQSTADALRARYPGGVMIEEYIDGDDVSVGWIEGVGVLPPILYSYEPTGPHRIYDLELKQSARVRHTIPPPFDRAIVRALVVAAQSAFEALGVAGLGRADFRVTPAGEVYFLEMNPLPSLAASDPELFEAASVLGISRRDFLARIIEATRRHGGVLECSTIGLDEPRRSSRSRSIRNHGAR